ncbi:MAG: carboxypeptidase-like regulatory domain-containing protein [Ignavibacteriae bacterium]|nr:carboxypeptidase-like regulatory domain-containing protein [Ignavibacteriota bacterium]
MTWQISLLLLCITVSATGEERHALHGRIADRTTGEPLPAAHVRILNSSRGTITGSAGGYALQLEPGNYRVVVRMLGYRPDTSLVSIHGDIRHDVLLDPSDIVLPEVLVTSEDPAVEIIRRAIAAKRAWISRLTSFQSNGFTRQVLLRDTSIASITESFTTVYWQQGDTLREVVKQRRQTENVKSSFNFASVGQIVNFNEDDVRFLGYTFVGPTSVDALDYYAYKLLRTEKNRGHDIYVIQMTPRSRTTPMFNGTIRIADVSYALMGVDVVPNEVFAIPFVKSLKVRYRQQFSLEQEEFWLPADIRIDGHAKISVAGFSFPAIGFQQSSILSDYAINPSLPDSIFRRPRLTVDSSAVRLDSTFWKANDVLPLSPEEKIAYASLDSTRTLAVQFRPGGISATIGGDGGTAASVLSFLDLSFNRVEGFHLGVKYENERILPLLGIDAGFAYGLSDKRTKYRLGVTVFTSAAHHLGFGAEIYRTTDHRPGGDDYGTIANSVTSLLSRNDYHDYHEAEGWKGFVRFSSGRRLTAQLSLINEDHRAVGNRTSFSLFARSRSYRENPRVPEGTLRGFQVRARIGNPPVPLDMIRTNALELSVEHSTPALLSSSYDFTRYEAHGTLVIPTFAPGLLFRPDLTLMVSAGDLRGTQVPIQRLFNIESSSSGYGPSGVMRSMDVKEYGGTGYLAVHAEHNFRALPFLALGIPFLYENNIEFLMHGGAARTWSTGRTVNPFRTGWFSEIGFGFNRIFDILRADLSWRLNEPRPVRITLGVVRIL